MKRAVVMMVVAGALAGSAASSSSTGSTVDALVYQDRAVLLASLDATTLEPRGRMLPLGRGQGSVFTDRLGDRLAVASAGIGVAIVDTRRAKLVWRLPRGTLVRAVAWLSPSNLLVAEHGSVLLLDPNRKRIVSRVDYEGNVMGAARWKDGLVLLAERGAGAIEPARLVVVGPGTRVRTLNLTRIAAGRDGGENNQGPYRVAEPALAVDVAGNNAFVAGGMQVATVDLATLAVDYRGAERTLQKAAVSGPRRSAGWLGNGVLAVAGDDLGASGDDHSTLTSTPFGLRFVTATGVEVVDASATNVRIAGNLALAYGMRYAEGHGVGMGLVAYDRSGILRWRLFGDAAIGPFVVANGLAYVRTPGQVNVVDLGTGSLLVSARDPWRTFLLVG